MKHVMKLCVLSMLLLISGCNGKVPELPKMETCHVPYTAPADINNTSCPHDAHFYTCVRIKKQKNTAAYKYEAKMREANDGVCK